MEPIEAMDSTWTPQMGSDGDYARFLNLDFDAFEAAAAGGAGAASAFNGLQGIQGEQSINQAANQPISQSANQSANQPMSQSMNQSTSLSQTPLSQSMNQSTSLSQTSLSQTSLSQSINQPSLNHLQQLHLQMQLQCGFGHYLNSIPATPQSLGISPAGQFYSDGMLNVAPYGMGDGAVFSPLVSPAVTPLDQSFSLAEYAMPSAAFSPLVSPALHATTDSPLMYAANHGTAGSSPTEMDLDAVLPPAFSADGPRKARKPNVAKVKSSRPAVRQSPIAKPQHKKRSTSHVAAHILNELGSARGKSINSNTSAAGVGASGNTSAASGNTSAAASDASVSPEPLSEMPPPPLPVKSASQSPYIAASQAKSPFTSPSDTPARATPASILKLAGERREKTPTSTQDGIDDFVLPPPMNPPAEEKRMASLSRQSSATSTPYLQPQSASTTPHLKPQSANTTPHLAPQTNAPSSTQPSTQSSTRPINPRLARKRASTSTASPALLPKLSPAIRPLLPGPSTCAPAEDEASRLLATKSNYTRILEGSNVLSYPSELATGLNSKRTSHKLAEQGRRNRMNLAIQQIATLLPGNQDVPDDDEGGKGGPNSKAHTVEMAMEYIRDLQGRLEEAERRAEEAERALTLK